MIERLETLTVADAIVEKILGYISSGEFQWGQRLPSQRELAKKMNVGVSSVREALQVLQAMGYAEMRRGQGTYITENPSVPLSKTMARTLYQDTGVANLMELREVLDVGLAVLSAKKASDEDSKTMQKHIDDLKASIGKDPAKAVDSDLNFHLAMAESVKNPLLAQFAMALRDSYEKFLEEVSHTRRGVDLHSHVVEAIRNHDPLGARDAMIELLKHTREIYLKEHFKKEKEEGK
jgi:GntR family transcriptional regulator, transcriptional repressor for pyruvate dehydrogenase complex